MIRLRLVLSFLFSALIASSQITVTADLTDAPRKLLHSELTFPVRPGPLTLYYPQWIPGEHAPSGPIDNLARLVFTANGKVIAWQRDDVNMFTIRLTVPEGATKLNARLDFLATAPATGFSSGASTSANLAVLSWNELLLYPAGLPPSQIIFKPSVKVPEGWKFGTALSSASEQGTTTHFRSVPLNTLIDSPLLAGRFFKEIPLAPEITPKHYLDMAADGPEDLEITAEQTRTFSNLVREASALYASHHYESYHFLLTLSDQVAHFGLEHHQSSDDRVEARALIDEELSLLNSDLLPHEFTHSWNGKYRRPAGLVTEDYQHPMKADLLWVYEGLTQYLGDVLACRSGIWNADQFRSYLAASAAELDHRPGRTWRDLQDTATAARILYSTPKAWDNWRRSTDFYAEGELIWLEADTTIRQLSNGSKSLNNFLASFLGLGGDTPPKLVPYTFEDLVAALNAIQPYDWTGFFRARLDSKSPHAPLTGIKKGGYEIQYTAQANAYVGAEEYRDHGVNAWYSVGFNTITDNAIDDVLLNSPAYRAGLGPGMKIVAVDGRRATEDLLHQAIQNSKKDPKPIELIVENDGFFKVVKVDYHRGERYPHLVKQSAANPLLDEILKPLSAKTP
ncbi:MAG: M61 family peptidase [Acidobacteriota bacterium]|nr:M61 family peptidase [Acidobacteriota bacterium]